MSTLTFEDRAPVSAWRTYLSQLWQRREFGWFLAMGNLRARNASTLLGLFWWIVNPVLMALIYFIVFGLIFPGTRGAEHQFLAYLMSGVFVFNFVVTSMTSGANSILANARLLVNIRFPRLILPMSAIFETSVGFLTSLAVFYLIAWPVNGVAPSLTLLALPAVFIGSAIFNLGLASLTARLAIPFRDINNLIPHITRLWLYLSPVIWPVTFLDGLPTWAARIFKANPMYSMLEAYRYALMGRPIHRNEIIMLAIWVVVIGFGGILSFVRFEGNMVRYL
jgi:teichoic acid transport system permease protein